MSDAPSKHAVEAATLVLVEMLRSPEASKAFSKSKGENAATEVTEAHQKLIDHFDKFPDFDAIQARSRAKAMCS